MNVSFERASNTTDEWYTPKEIVDSLGVFDLDPCAPVHRLWDTAKQHYTIHDNGLSKEWHGRVWCNPPYSRPKVVEFAKKMVEHGNGIMLVFSRCDTALFHDWLFPYATAMMFVRGRIAFVRPDGSARYGGGCGSVFFAFGEENAQALEDSGINGKFIRL